MSSFSSMGLTEQQVGGWRDFFQAGDVFVATVDRTRLDRRMKINTVVMVVAGTVFALAVIGIVLGLLSDFARVATVILLSGLAIAAAALFVRFLLTRKRLRAGQASVDDYLVVSPEGIKLAGGIDLPWSAVPGGVGFDARGVSGNRPAMRISRAAGVAESEFVLAVNEVRALRDATPKEFHGLFEVIADQGGIRIPLDNIVAPDDVRTSIVAIAVAGQLAGRRTIVTATKEVIAKGTMAALGDPAKFTQAMDAAEATEGKG